MKRALIIQGPSSNVLELKKCWSGYDIIWSTWMGEECKYDKEDVVIYNEVPNDTGVGNINLQRVSTLNGSIKAKELGYDRVLKWRSDMVSTNPKKLLSSFKHGANFLFFHNTLPDRIGYFVDYIIESDIDTMMSIWDFNELYSTHAEAIITSNIKQKKITDINLFGGTLNDENDIIWLKRDIMIKDYKNFKEFEYDAYEI